MEPSAAGSVQMGPFTQRRRELLDEVWIFGIPAEALPRQRDRADFFGGGVASVPKGGPMARRRLASYALEAMISRSSSVRSTRTRRPSPGRRTTGSLPASAQLRTVQ